uniref:BHLH domain-containing protein n=1 Tax=Ciona intestinalis TaxID=7719 RepID=F6T9S9_CIOIN|nr:transcription factor protein isoform X1 [Ciona intestinalis]|eukprot:XP_009861536.1 transcription factor protein isoform X1 [Ciona intestinalis]
MKLSTPINTDPIMSQFDELRPLFYYNQEEDLPPSSPTYGACLSEEIWKKFELLPTPPRSPEHFGSLDSDLDPESLVPDTDSYFADNTLSMVKESLGEIPTEQVLPSVDLTSNFSNKPEAQSNEIDASYKLIKDCMWNGIGHKPHSEVSRVGRPRNVSPGSQRFNAANGCVNPLAVFTVNSATEKRRLSPTSNISAKRRAEPLETTSDSDEEIDVVTVDKANHTTTTLGVVSQGRKYVGTLVARQNGKHRQLELVTTGVNRLQDRTPINDDQIRGRTKAKLQIGQQVTSNGQKKTVMIVKNRNVVSLTNKTGTQQQVNVQLKRLPVVNSTTVAASATATKRRYSSPGEKTSNGVHQIMRMATPSALMGINENGKENANVTDVAAPVGPKRRFLSLDGVSMVSNTGVMRHRSELANKLNAFANSTNPSLANDIPELKSLKTVQPIKTERIYAPVPITEKKKYAKKTKAKIVQTFDSPASSPASSNGDAPTSPQKTRTASSETTSSSSGSDEELIRVAHNVLERQRREGLRTSFHTLRKCVPELAEQERTPKVTILKKARDYSFQLQQEHAQLQSEKARLQQRQLALQQRLRSLASEISSVKTISIPATVKCERVVGVPEVATVTYVVQDVTATNTQEDMEDDRTSVFYQNNDCYSDYEAEISGEEAYIAEDHLKETFTNVYSF